MRKSFRFFLGLALTLTLTSTATPPGWWSDGQDPALNEAASNNKGAANTGQGKWMATCALRALKDELGPNSAAAQAIDGELFKSSENDPEGVFLAGRPETPSVAWLENQRQPLQIGALKALAAPFYRHLCDLDAEWVEDQLQANGLTVKGTDYFEDTDGTFYPWDPADNSNTGNNRSMVNIGQLKLVFSLDFSTFPSQGPQFVTRPVHNSKVLISDGVIVAFDLPSLALPGSDLPSRIDVSVRPHGTTQPWSQVGRVTQFALRGGVEFVRGSTVWIPDAAGVYEVKADAYGPTGGFVASNIRKVMVLDTHAPAIEIVGGPDSPSTDPLNAVFTTVVSDPDPGDSVKSVAFYDNGVLIGIDYSAPFGNSISDQPVVLYKGSHEITAKAYDQHNKSTVSDSYEVEITGGESRPSLTITSPADGTLLSPNTNLVVGLNVSHPDSDAFVELKARVLETSAEISVTSAPFNSITIPYGALQQGENTVVITIEDDDQILSYEAVLHVHLGSTLPDLLVAEITDETTVAASNVRYRGVELASNVFNQGSDTGLQMDSGALLTSGSFSFWDGNDVSEEREVQWFTKGDEKLANRIVGSSTRDAAVLEFDVECDHSQMELEVQFGSEEFIEYIGSFNDAFMVTVDDAVVSLTPDGGDILALHSATPDVRSHLYQDDDEIDLVASSTRQVEYDGVTVKLRLHAFVTPNETHKVRIVIADVNDARLDSGLFIERASLRSVDPLN
jgi:hypothetical protein